MLKLTYTEVGLHMERIVGTLEGTIAHRVILALRVGQTLYVEPGHASFLLPATAPGLLQLKQALGLESAIVIMPVDTEWVEVSVTGSWIAEHVAAHEGMFITALSDRAEFLVYKLWSATQNQVSSLT
jgi:hypothetical protein